MCKGIPKYNGTFGEKDWNGLQTNYRILADHTRMLTACLADGMIPEEKYLTRLNKYTINRLSSHKNVTARN